MSTKNTLSIAIQYHKLRNLKKAEQLYQEVIKNNPNNSDALHLFGLVAHQNGNNGAAIEYMKKALKISPSNEVFYLNLGNVYSGIEMLNRAIECFKKAISINPDYADAYYNLGRTLQKQGKNDQALINYHKTIEFKSDNPYAYYYSGNVLFEQKKFDDSIKYYEQAVKLKPDFPEVFNNLGIVLKMKGKFLAAVSSFKEAIKLNPEFAEAYYNMGNALNKLDKCMEALDCYREAIRLNHHYAEAYFMIGKILQNLNFLEEAVQCYHEAINNKPDYSEAYSDLGGIFREQGKLKEGLKSALKAVNLQSDNPSALNNLGNIYKEMGNFKQAKQCYQRAIKIKPDMVEAYANLGDAYLNILDLKNALYYTNKAIEIQPDFNARWNRALLFLLTENFEEGWHEYKWRWKTKDFVKIKRNYPQPLWDGTPQNDKTILIWVEQGFGDTIQFIRYASLIKQRVKKVVFEVQQPLVKLISTCPGIDKVIPLGINTQEFDIHIPLLSLPGIFNTNLKNIPCHVPYISLPDGHKIDNSLIIKENDKLKIGIVWAGNPKHKNNRNRSCPVSHFIELGENEDVVLFSLQKGPQSQDLNRYRAEGKVIDLSDIMNDFSDTAAMLEELDLVITVDTAMTHLAGALCKPVWVLLPFCPDWRWLLNRSDSPWYPTARLFRQSKPGDWKGVFIQVKEALNKMIIEKGIQ